MEAWGNQASTCRQVGTEMSKNDGAMGSTMGDMSVHNQKELTCWEKKEGSWVLKEVRLAGIPQRAHGD